MTELSSKPIRYVTIDGMLPYVGEFNTFQWLIETFFCLMVIPQTYPLLIMYFAAMNPTWQCVANSTSCTTLNETFTSDNTVRCNIPRNEWKYTVPNDYSIVTQFDIFCHKEWQIHLTTSIFFVSWGFGGVIMGWLADNYGRKVVILPSAVIITITSFVTAFSPNVYWFVVFRFIVGFFTPGAMVQEFVLLSELVGSHHRPKAGLIFWLTTTIALCVLGIQAYLVQQWKLLFIICSVPYLVFLPFYKFVPESVRWLRLNGKADEVMRIFSRIAVWNKKEIPSDIQIIPAFENEKTKHKSYPFDLFRTKHLAKETLIQAYVWMVNAMAYYGLSLASSDLGGSLYRNFVLLSIIEFPANLAAIYFLEKIGRKRTIVISMVLGCIACIGVAFVPDDNNAINVKVCLGMIGKFFATLSFNSVYTWSVEIFPTSTRAEGMGFLQVTSRIGAASSPWVAKGLKTLHKSIPFVVMGTTGLIGCVLALFLPETKGMATAETANDVKPNNSNEMESVGLIEE